ncbi:TIGR02611 family protein [Actinokineospora globicatena]|uniref:TIGR02611 family protein n=1 Tax=Actinokineospora globicatena TaxID=103729 RepID=UPI0020A42476|nr:TIGR02611 family protein [Actinokineospora globicatena]MCP2304084.1 TIGR02611 family protein [Actinokineospora globicatena]GLW78566.1 TIGR02611 family protein [Actinokineospora globicatena]GLW84770.1 TIGR02611 family protein [Actinokineospora globicatena]
MADEAREKGALRPDWADRNATTRTVWRVGVGLAGGLVLVAGIIMIPYPGPGWLVVFAGLAILAVEFTWARRTLTYARGKYDAWTDWLKRQHLAVRLLVLALTALIVVTTIWLLNGFALVGGWFGIHWPWLGSPLFT